MPTWRVQASFSYMARSVERNWYKKRNQRWALLSFLNFQRRPKGLSQAITLFRRASHVFILSNANSLSTIPQIIFSRKKIPQIKLFQIQPIFLILLTLWFEPSSSSNLLQQAEIKSGWWVQTIWRVPMRQFIDDIENLINSLKLYCSVRN